MDCKLGTHHILVLYSNLLISPNSLHTILTLIGSLYIFSQVFALQ